MGNVGAIFLAILAAIVVVGIFLIIREALLWYWGINQIYNTLNLILDELKKISSKKSLPA
jgi:phosphotransferase system  glucose/maltose/N-acetylglucosamine-specific IIC component